MREDDRLLDFDEFRAAVGASIRTVRTALLVLRLDPVPLASDRRKLRYRAAWVPTVQAWITANLGAIAD